MLSHGYGVYSFSIRPSDISYPRARMKCIVTQAFLEEEKIRFYEGTLVYKLMFETLSSLGVYEKVVMEVSCEYFDTSAILLTKKGLVRTKIRRSLTGSSWICNFEVYHLRSVFSDDFSSTGRVQREAWSKSNKLDKLGTTFSNYSMSIADPMLASCNKIPKMENFVD